MSLFQSLKVFSVAATCFFTDAARQAPPQFVGKNVTYLVDKFDDANDLYGEACQSPLGDRNDIPPFRSADTDQERRSNLISNFSEGIEERLIWDRKNWTRSHVLRKLADLDRRFDS